MVEASGEIGILGLGRMGANIARHALTQGIKVVGFDIKNVSSDLITAGLVKVSKLSEFRNGLERVRAIFTYVPAGPIVDRIIDDLVPHLDMGDIIIDAGNSYWGDSIRRYKRLLDKGINFIDLGTSGGIEGARQGACFMAGGDKEPVAYVEQLLIKLATPGGYIHAGPPGAGHFTKLVHNGIEFGMLQAIGEGIDLLKNYRDELDIAEVLRCWRHGSVIRSWLIDLMEAAYRGEGGLDKVPAYVEDTGEVNWLVNDALRMEVPIPVISQAVMQLFASRDDNKNWARAIAMMRHGFGGHPYGVDQSVQQERRQGRVGDFLREP